MAAGHVVHSEEAKPSFRGRHERVLKVYRRPYDPRHPVVCMDEMSKQLVAEVREKLPVRPGPPEKYDDAHYLRRGECTVWMFGEPLSGWRTVAVTKRRTTLDWAKQVRALANLPRSRDAESITLVCDNLNTHSGDSSYAAAFPAAEASRLNDRIHLVHTPKHGSWLNVAELEFSALHRQCLDRRIESRALVTSETAAWTKERNREQTGVDWQLSVDDARTKLKNLYPKIKTS